MATYLGLGELCGKPTEVLNEKARDPRPLVVVVEHTSLPPAINHRPGGILTITHDTFSLFSQAPATTSSSGGEGSATVAPSIPVDQVTRGGSSSCARSTRVNPRASQQGCPVRERGTGGDSPVRPRGNPQPQGVLLLIYFNAY